MSAREQPADRLVAASYNIHSAVGRDGEFSPERILRVIHGLEAAIVGLQEVDAHVGETRHFDQFRFFTELSGMHCVMGPSIVGERGEYGNLLLSELPIVSSRQIDLSVGAREPRGAICALVDCGAVTLQVVNTHLGLRFGERASQVARLAAALGAHDGPTLLLGDFNVWWRRSRLLRALDAPRVRGVLPLSWPVRRPLFALDRIWSRPAHLVERVEAVRDELTLLASDHLPVRAVLRLACRR